MRRARWRYFMELLVLGACLWGGILWGTLGVAPTWVLAAAAICALLSLGSGVLGRIGFGAALFALGTLFNAAPAEPSFRGGLAKLTVETFRTSCGDTSCWSEAKLVRCQALDEGACPDELGVRAGLVSLEEPPLGATLTLIGRVTFRPSFRNLTPHPAWMHAPPSVVINAARSGVPPRIVSASWLGRAVTWSRVVVRKVLDASLARPHAGIARALLLGDGSAVDRELDAAIRQAGVSHVLAVSGMHVTVLAGALVALLRLLWLLSPLALHFPAARASAALGVLLAPLVACLCGSAPSAFRAAWTSAAMFAVQALGRRPCPLRVSALSVAVYSVCDPLSARHPGFVLSVLATVALLTATGSSAGLVAAAKESARAWLSTAPFLVWVFGGTSLISLLANVVLLPLGAALIPIAIAHLGVALLGLGSVTAWVFETTSGAFVGSSRLLAQLDPAINVPPLTPLQGALWAVCAWIWLVPIAVRARLIVSVSCLLAGGACELALRHTLAADEVRVTYLDVGQGDSALIETGTGPTMLIDGGGAIQGGPDPGAQAIVPLLRARRISHLDVMVLSHPHPDHYGGLFAVLENVHVGELWDSGQGEAEDPGGRASALLAEARRRGVRVRRPDALCGRTRALGNVKLSVLAPCPGFDEAFEANDNSLVLRATRGQRRFLFMGDVERGAEAGLVARRVDLRADVLKVGHHGSRTSSTEAFVRAVAPGFAVISAGRGNRFGHPHAEVTARLTHLVREVLRVDVLGSVELTSNGRALKVRTAAPPR